MITFTLIFILGALLVLVLVQLAKKPAARSPRSFPPPPPAEDLANLKVSDARSGDVISISGAGDDMSDLDLAVDRLDRVEAGSRRWNELSGPYRERRVTLRAGGYGETEAALRSDVRQITLEDLGLSEDDLAQMDERQNTADSFVFEDKVWFYRLSREARARPDDGGPAFGFYYWEFHEENGKRFLDIRKAEGDPFTTAMYTEIPAGDVTVYRGDAQPRAQGGGRV